jgi:inorganic triphosphatase YgiF
MTAPDEIEAKYQISDPTVFTTIMGLSALGDYHLQPAQTVDQLNTYFDTASRKLRQARHGFRIRQAKERLVATLKGPVQLDGAIHRRDEYEVATPSLDPADLPAGDLRDLLWQLTAAEPLLPLLQIRTQRQVILIARDQQPRLELALDQSQIHAGARSESFCELELELLPAGDLADLAAVVAAFQALFPLVPESQSKLERGLKLLGEDL